MNKLLLKIHGVCFYTDGSLKREDSQYESRWKVQDDHLFIWSPSLKAWKPYGMEHEFAKTVIRAYNNYIAEILEQELLNES